MAGKIRWIFKFFRENYITGKTKSGGLNLVVFRKFRHILIPATIFTRHNITRHSL